VKTWPVLGQQGISFKGNTLIDSGTSIAGMAYYVAEFYESELWNPVIRDGKVIGDFVITDAFGNSSRTKIIFRGDSIEKVKTLIENIELIH